MSSFTATVLKWGEDFVCCLSRCSFSTFFCRPYSWAGPNYVIKMFKTKMNPWTRINLTSAISLLQIACSSGWMLSLVWMVASHSSPVCFSTSTAHLCADWSPTSSPLYFPLVTASLLQVASDPSLVALTDICNGLPCYFGLLWLISSECTPQQTDCEWIIQAPSPRARSIPVAAVHYHL